MREKATDWEKIFINHKLVVSTKYKEVLITR